jgi:hypothetical protein
MFVEADVEPGNPANDQFLWLLLWVVGTLGNADFLAIFIRRRDTTNACVINLIVGNILATLCLPANYLHYFYRGSGLGFPIWEAYLTSRDIATGVQTFSVVVYSALKFTNVKSPDNYEAVPASLSHSATLSGHKLNHCITPACQTFVIWTLAICCSVTAAVIPETSPASDVFEDTNTKLRVIFHCVTFFIIPQILIISFYILTKFMRRNIADKLENEDEGLVFCLACAVMINYAPLYSWLAYSWSQRRLLTVAVVDLATYFPLYATACWTPVLLYFVDEMSRKQSHRSVINVTPSPHRLLITG